MTNAATSIDVRIVGDGPLDPSERAAIVEAVARVMRDREEPVVLKGSDWARAGRLEGVGLAAVRSRAALRPV